MSRVTICDVAPRDGLQNDADDARAGVRAELVDRLAARRAAADRGGQLRQPRAACRRWPARRRSSRRSSARPGVVYAGLVAQRARLRPPAPRPGSTRCTSPSPRRRRSTSGTRARRSTESLEAAERIVARAHADGIRATVTIGVSFGCPFEGAVDPARVLELAEQARRRRRRRDRPRRHGRRRRARARSRGSSATASTLGRPGRRPPAQHAQHRLRERVRGARGGRDGARRVRRRHRRLPVRAARDREHRHRGSRLHAARRGRSRRASTSTRSIGVAEWLEGVLGRQLEGQVYRAGTFAPVAGLKKGEANGVQARGRRRGHLHRPLPRRRRERRAAQYRVKTPSTPSDPSRGRAQRRAADLRGGRHRASATCATSCTARRSRRTRCSSRRARASA